MRKLTALTCLALAFGLGIGLAAPQANQDRLTGNWKVMFLDDRILLTFWHLKLEVKDGKLAGTLDAAPQGPQVTIKELVLKGDMLTIKVMYSGQPMDFAIMVPKDAAKRLGGTMSFSGNVYAAQLESTKEEDAKSFTVQAKLAVPTGDFKEFKEEVAKKADELAVFTLASLMISEAAKAKVDPGDLKDALAPALKASRNYGDWHREVLIKLARNLSSKEAYAGLGEEMAKDALKAFGANADASTELRCLDVIAASLLKQDKKVALKDLQTRIDALETKGHTENEKAGLGFEPAKFKRDKGSRVVLVELFTGAQCPPCVAADLAFEGLAKSYSTSEVVLLQYHLHIPRPDPMTTPDSEARQKYYGDKVRGTPSIFFNGTSAAGGGGGKGAAGAKYTQYRDVVNPLLEDASKIKLNIDAKRAGDALSITAAATGYKANEKLRLRLALVEPWVRYPGTNGLSYHAHVVRGLPGGADGFPLDKEDARQSTTVNLAEVRQLADKHLQRVDDYLNGHRTFSFRDLRIVGFVQDDESKEVLHAIEVKVK